MKAGKLIVLEGTDGSGKSTQFKLLCSRLEAEGRPFRRLVFPQYQQPSSALIRMYLGGEFGSHPSDVNPYAASAFYAVDRYASWKKVWGSWYEGGGLVLSDRYTTSNAVHQTCKLPEAEWEGFIRWLFDFECGKLGLPLPDLVIYLDMPTEKALELLRRREADTHAAQRNSGIDQRPPGHIRVIAAVLFHGTGNEIRSTLYILNGQIQSHPLWDSKGNLAALLPCQQHPGRRLSSRRGT